MVRVISAEHAVLEVAGAIDMAEACALRNEINRVVGDNARVVVDLTCACRLGPRGLALLVDEHAWLAQHGGELRIVSRRPDAELARLFHLYLTVDEALA